MNQSKYINFIDVAAIDIHISLYDIIDIFYFKVE